VADRSDGARRAGPRVAGAVSRARVGGIARGSIA
jgi:hypothetical protein